MFSLVIHETPTDPCAASPCGPNSQCRAPNGYAICSCLPNYIGSPPSCRPECIISSDCALNKACINERCGDPCPGVCGNNAKCQVINHSAVCSCPLGQTGDPFVRCVAVPVKPIEDERKTCIPSPCGPNSDCREVRGQTVCSCLPNYIGSPPGCRPQCTSNSECPVNTACINKKCGDPCEGACGQRALCKVFSHRAACFCESGYTGDPFSGCEPIPSMFEVYLLYELFFFQRIFLVSLFKYWKNLKKFRCLAIHHLVDQTQYVRNIMAPLPAYVCQNILEMHMKDVVLNVL
jgi:hypothetical protein